MPRSDQTGPKGEGAMTGRKAGRCTNFGAGKAGKGKTDGSEKDKNAPEPETETGGAAGQGRGQGRGQDREQGGGQSNGQGIKSLLDSLQIQMVVYKEPEKTVQSVIDMLN